MRLSTAEIVVVGVVIVYLAFFSNPPPAFVKSLLETPIGKVVALLAVLYVTVYQSLIIGVFLAVAFIMSASKVTEYLDNPKKKEGSKQPSSNMDSMAEAKDIIKGMMKKGDKLPSAQGKSVTAPPPAEHKPKPATPTPPKGKTGIEKFASF